MPTDILIATGEFPPYAGGAGLYAADFAGALKRRGFSVTVLAPEYCRSSGDMPDFGLDDIIPNWPVRSWKPKRIWQASRILARTISSLQPKLVVLADVNAHRAGVFQWKTRPVVIALGSEIVSLFQRPLLRACFSSVYKRARLVVAISEFARETILELGIAPENIAVYTPGVAPEFVGPPPDPARTLGLREKWGVSTDTSVVLTVARLTERKGIDTSIRAIAELIRQDRDVTYLIAGTGPERQSLERQARDLGCHDRVRFLGGVSEQDKIELYDLCDCYIMLSRRVGFDVEGYGISFTEASLREKPAVGSWHGGIPEIVEHEATGFLVEPQDAGAAAGYLSRVLADPGLARRLGEAGRQRMLGILQDRHLGPIEMLLQDS